VPQIVFGRRALADLERLSVFLEDRDAEARLRAIDTILDAIGVLARHPMIGRALEGAVRELVIGYGDTGYVALYRIRPRLDRVEILSVRHQREAGYS